MKFHWALYPLLLFLLNPLFSQPIRNDSLLRALKTVSSDFEKVNTLLALADASLNNHPGKSEIYCQEALQLSEKMKYQQGIANALIRTGFLYIRFGNYEEALVRLSRGLTQSMSIGDSTGIATANIGMGMVHCIRSNYSQAMNRIFRALEISKQIKPSGASDKIREKLMGDCFSHIGMVLEKQGIYTESMANQETALSFRKAAGDEEGIAHSYNCIGMLYRDQSNYTEGMKNHLAALKIQEVADDRYGKAFTLWNMGFIHILQANYPEAMTDLKQSLQLYTLLRSKKGIADANNIIGWCHAEQKHWSDGLKYFQTALFLFTEINDKQNMAMSYNNSGLAWKYLGDYTKAKENLFKAVAISQDIGDRLSSAEIYESIGETFASEANYPEALSWFKKAMGLSIQLGAKRITKECYIELARIYAKLNDFGNAYKYQNLYSDIKEKIDEESGKEVRSMIVIYEAQKKATLLKSEQFKKDVLAESELNNERTQRKWITFSSVLFLTGLVALAFLASGLSRNLKKNKRLTDELNATMVDLKSTQGQLVQSERMAAYGVLASRMAHEIQNPLNFVNNFSELSQDLVKDIIESESQETKNSALDLLTQNLQKIHHHGRRVSDIISELQQQALKGKVHQYFDGN